jgi:hypothetical protein
VSTPTSTDRGRRLFLALGTLVLAGTAVYLVGGVGYGFAAEYGGGLFGAGLGQLVLLASIIVGGLGALLMGLLLRVTGHRRPADAPLLVAAVLFCVVVGSVGTVLGGAAHERSQRAAAQSCLAGVGAAMREFAAAARPPESPYRPTPQGTASGCMIDVAIPSKVTDPYGYVSERVEGIGFAPVPAESWRRAGLEVWMRADQPEGEKEYLVAFYGVADE